MLIDAGRPAPAGFVHQAIVYQDDAGYVRRLANDFVSDGLEAGEAVLVAVPGDRLAMLRDALGDRNGSVEWIDLTEAGRNPARIIPLWRDFLDRWAASGRAVRGVGEPAYPGRSDAGMEEAVLHEALLNLAFGSLETACPFRLLCPYDARVLAPDVLDTVGRTHPSVPSNAVGRSDLFDPVGVASALFATALPPGPGRTERWPIALTELRALRERVHAAAVQHGLNSDQADDLMLATHEICKNSVRFAGGGTLAAWVEGDTLVCEVTDNGRITELLVGRSAPAPTADGGRGLWLVNQLCDLVQIRSSEAGTVVRLHACR